jgi:hypothetical protein
MRQEAAVEFVASVTPPNIGPHTIFHEVEIIVRRSEAFEKVFALAEPVAIDYLVAQLSYPALNRLSRLKALLFGQQDMAACIHVLSGNDFLCGFDVRGTPLNPPNLVYQMDFKGPLWIKELRYRVYDDMFHPTDARLTLLMHRWLPQS